MPFFVRLFLAPSSTRSLGNWLELSRLDDQRSVPVKAVSFLLPAGRPPEGALKHVVSQPVLPPNSLGFQLGHSGPRVQSENYTRLNKLTLPSLVKVGEDALRPFPVDPLDLRCSRHPSDQDGFGGPFASQCIAAVVFRGPAGIVIWL